MNTCKPGEFEINDGLMRNLTMIHSIIAPNLYSKREILKRLFLAIIWSQGIIYFIEYIIEDPEPDGMPIWQVRWISFAAFAFLSEALVLNEYWVERLFPIDEKNFTRRVSLQFLTSCVLCILVFGAVYHIFDAPTNPEYEKGAFLGLALGLWSMMMQVFIVLVNRMMRKWKETTKEMEALKREKMEMTITSLQDQLNPHFLFNNLSVLKSLVMLNQQKAALGFIQNFSEIYRYVLTQSEAMTVPLAEELAFIKQYAALHQERLDDALYMEYDIPEQHLQDHLPPMTLQLLVENALKHNIAEEGNELLIKIKIVAGYLVVSNNVQKKSSTYSTYKGLENLKRRCELLSSRPMIILENEQQFTVKVPLIQA
ncbi:sensor histidine kinase [Persicobacter sp. CCB-QB2]|uniref:sensor histidine kinase n=1 Tax=Persicobacter sp. CCB-QB2 TaxID=1561025 RepID=UPI0006A95CA4|nr:histidine kinase [Persicobacter sp. CCB-QB2]